MDTIAPVITITLPLPVTYLDEHFTAVYGTVTDETPVSVTVSGIDTAVTNNTFTLSFISLFEGSNIITAIATDAAGNTGSDEIMVISDTLSPVVSIDTPLDGMKTNIAAQTISGSVTDASPIVSILLNGVSVPLVSGGFESQYSLEEGFNTISVAVSDLAGNTAIVSIMATLDTIPPDSPVINTLSVITNLINITVSGSAEPGSLVKISGAAEAFTDSTDGFSIPVSLSLDTLNSFTVTATDEVGNESLQTSFSIVQDSIPPAVTGFSLFADPKVTLLIPISITFTEELNPATISSSNITLQSPSGPVDGLFSIADTEVIFTPSAELAPNELFTLTVGTGITDKAGNNLASCFHRHIRDVERSGLYSG